jgi:hypothetical protein
MGPVLVRAEHLGRTATNGSSRIEHDHVSELGRALVLCILAQRTICG